MPTSVRLFKLAMLAGVLASCGSTPPEAEHRIPVNALCTVCEDFIRCDGGSSNAAVYDPTFDIYRLKPKGTAAQLATVWEFLIQLFYTRTEDHRPLSIYAQRPGEAANFRRRTTDDAEAWTDLVAHRIYLPEGWIDQVTGEWHGADDGIRGSCRLLKRDEGREMLKLFADHVADEAL